jgi:type VI secretion system protein ImpK
MSDRDDPFLSTERIERPRPGAGARGGGSPPPSRPPSSYPPEPSSHPIPAVLGIGANPLVEAASPLLLLMAQLRSSPPAVDVPALRRQALDEIRRFEERARGAGVRHEIVLAARYALCAGLDEAALSTPWGAQSEWTEHSLLITLHREMWGGEKFFEMLDRVSADPDRHLDLLELQYLELALGFTGKYHVSERGQEELADLQHSLYRTIQQRRAAPTPELSLQWRGVSDRRNRLIRYVPAWVLAAALLLVVGGTFATYQWWLSTHAARLEARLASLSEGDPIEAPAPAPVPGPTLKQLLKSEEDKHTMTVVENGPRTVVTLVGDDLFRSGSATVNPAYQQAIDTLADALNRVPGSVRIIGHTDDQPIRRLTFPDNFVLSRERAVSVANALKSRIDHPARLSWTGLGDTKPLYQPVSAPENRARNRRVEIVHLRGM